MAGAIPFGCGQCLPCRINRRRQWMWRQYLEGLCHAENSFVTLTYDDEHLPDKGVLVPRDLQLFLKSLRKCISPVRVRYFAVGEYGEDNKRPHYHLSLFGVCGDTFINGKPVAEYGYVRGKLCVVGGWIHECWSRGFVDVREFNHLTAQYVAGYTVKKLTDWKNGQVFAVPEFARMSNRPGIGADAVRTIGRALVDTAQGWESGDVPSQLRIGGKLVPLGRYLLDKLRSEVGFTEEYKKEVRDSKTFERSIELQAMLENSKGAGTFKAAFLENVEGQILQVEARAKIFRKRDVL